MHCRVCANKINPFVSFGKMPIANGFLKKEQFENEYFFELATAFCDRCYSVQLVTQPDPKLMFHDNYAFFSKTSKSMQVHFQKYADWVLNNYLKKEDSFVVELGSNDGILLENFSKKKIRHLGVEPSANVADVAIKSGINTEVAFFNNDFAKKIKEKNGKADAILAANVMCHIPDLIEIGKASKTLLKEDGVLIFEDPYLGDMINKVSYDQIYDEHVFIFSALSVKNIFDISGFELIDVLPQETHGGSMRYVLCKKGIRSISENVINTIKVEKELGLDKSLTYERFKNNCEHSKDKIISKLKKFKKEGKKIVGYGATSKSTTILNYCNIGPDLIDFISDTTPIKQNKYTPGMHIPVKPYEDFLKYSPEIAVLFAWNHRKEIENKEKKFIENGGKFISHIS
ncbi:class I SAM-dependent methyltransferase [Candidatus Pelagibacter bacterium]|jgi:methylation protein EvaC|nr:class I SAM-dependent methyltransferase [Candidatus Pelagibacter bacterium]MDB4217783.1 class I SAM-dependent methyltransferase [Candidatus Pelagibacter sp.]